MSYVNLNFGRSLDRHLWPFDEQRARLLYARARAVSQASLAVALLLLQPLLLQSKDNNNDNDDHNNNNASLLLLPLLLLPVRVAARNKITNSTTIDLGIAWILLAQWIHCARA